MNKKIKNLIATGLIYTLVFMSLIPIGSVSALEIASPQAPQTVVATPVPAQDPQMATGIAPTQAPEPTPVQSETTERERRNRDSSNNESGYTAPQESGTQSQTGDTSVGGNVGDSSITTGDANNNANLLTEGNNNYSDDDCCELGTTASKNSGNGAGSTNNSNSTSNSNNSTDQANDAIVGNNANLSSNTGDNDLNKNVGDSMIMTGDANISATAITTVNTNIDGVAVAEFDVVEDQKGDLVLDFAANCVSGCGLFGSTSATNTGNGADSTNNSNVYIDENNLTNQNNNAVIGNDMVLNANSGYNSTSMNTGGDNSIATGDANVSANMLTMANNNFAGNVLYGVVNIYGDLEGDIMLPTDQFASMTSANTGNGAGSTNNSTTTTNSNNLTDQTNNANIANNINFDANTGGNDASMNTGGTSNIETGDSQADVSVMNIANLNMIGGTWWLVLVNEAGNWVGKIVGSPDGQNYAGSDNIMFSVGPNGEITATNSGNGADSTNNSNVTANSNNQTIQNNDANIVNNLDLSANTGENNANMNTNGNNSIVTGDAKIIANIVNFVNNNIVGDGKLVVTVVNVFGSWLGDFVSPGQTKQAKTTTNTGSPALASNAVNNTTNAQENISNTEENNVEPTGTTKSNGTTSNAPSNNSVSTGSVNSNSDSSTTTNENTAVLGESIVKTQGATDSKAKLNLAWIILLTPLAIVVLKRKFIYAKLSLLKK